MNRSSISNPKLPWFHVTILNQGFNLNNDPLCPPQVHPLTGVVFKLQPDHLGKSNVLPDHHYTHSTAQQQT
jgi:hypothetical protein